MLHKKYRLTKTKDVVLITKRGRNFFGPYFVVKYLPSHKQTLSRFTVVVSTKVSKKAVTRNRIKRIIREVIRLHLSQFKLGDYVIIVKPKITTIQDASIAKEFIRQLRYNRNILDA